MLLHEEAQLLETGLRSTRFASESEPVSGSGLGVRAGDTVRVTNRPSCGGFVFSQLACCRCTSAFCSDSSAATWCVRGREKGEEGFGQGSTGQGLGQGQR